MRGGCSRGGSGSSGSSSGSGGGGCILVVVVALEGLFRQGLGFLAEVFGHGFVAAVGGAVEVADPGHFELEVFVLAVFVREVDDPGGFLDAVGEVELERGEVELFELRFGDLTAFSRGGAVVALFLSSKVGIRRESERGKR